MAYQPDRQPDLQYADPANKAIVGTGAFAPLFRYSPGRRAEESRKLRNHDAGIYRPEGAAEPDLTLRPRGGETPWKRWAIKTPHNMDHLYDAFLKLADKGPGIWL